MISPNLLKVESGRWVTYLANYRKLHSKWQNRGDSKNVKQPINCTSYKKLSKWNYIAWEAGEGSDVSWDTLNESIGLIIMIPPQVLKNLPLNLLLPDSLDTRVFSEDTVTEPPDFGSSNIRLPLFLNTSQGSTPVTSPAHKQRTAKDCFSTLSLVTEIPICS